MSIQSRDPVTDRAAPTEDSPISFYCKLEDDNAVKDYLRGGRCLRFTGVKSSEWNEVSLRQGVDVYVIDVDFWSTNKGNGLSFIGTHKQSLVEHQPVSDWFLLEFTPGKGRNYYYAAFSDPSENKPTFGSVLLDLDPKAGPELPTPPSVKSIKMDAGDDYSFYSFHVGQGMASLLDNEHDGVLFDAGAGCPIKRPDYPDLLVNDLKTAVQALHRIIMILSHPDLDHWRLLQWDPTLSGKIDSIYVPINTKQLVFSDKSVNKKIKVFDGTLIPLTVGSSLDLHRSQPSYPDKNGECLVCVFHARGQTVLILGDYVYERMRQDTNSLISGLANTSYTAIIVPHHGDFASSLGVFAARNSQSIAFFSAGTHKGYNHPTEASLVAHRQGGFKEVADKYQPNIVKVRLC
ncbi:hypothetical protein [Pseudomonas syringae]|uniref:hypothetical protein n=1 Tax=Pseudomonas syringae TaxID=317 RepID=UPI0006E56F00|nr:hypothetical protein [Pseudomonas syringae]KPY52531.1 Uncharacterized protein ALO48_04300 [Pseudomonas syringae pv. rhaphiolepidis]KWS45805.1 hypothetical protein AL060_11795 [Pseudomonas syringae pv. rhaphiolepidis]